MTFEIICTKIDEKRTLDFGSIFNRSLELFKKVWVQGFITLLLTFVCMLPFYLLFFVPMIAFGITSPEMMRQEELPVAVTVSIFLIMPLFFLGVITTSLALMAGFFRICKAKDMNEQRSDDYFYYLKKGRYKRLVLLSFLYIVMAVLGMLTCGIGLIYLIVPLSLIPAFFAFNEHLSPMELVRASFQLGNKNWLVIFGLLIIMGLVAELGFILCFIGVFFTAMLAKIPVYYCYKDGVGFSENQLL